MSMEGQSYVVNEEQASVIDRLDKAMGLKSVRSRRAWCRRWDFGAGIQVEDVELGRCDMGVSWLGKARDRSCASGHQIHALATIFSVIEGLKTKFTLHCYGQSSVSRCLTSESDISEEIRGVARIEGISRLGSVNPGHLQW